MSQQRTHQDVLEELLNSLLDETLSEADEARLAGMLTESATARTRYREWMELHAALHWDYAAAASNHPEPTLSMDTRLGLSNDADVVSAEASRSIGRHSLLIGGSLAMAGLLALAISWFTVLQRPGELAERQPSGATLLATGQIVEVASLGGAASWSVGGMLVSDLAVGNRLCAGTVNLEGESAFMTLRFDDGTAVTLAGKSMLEFDARWQKTLVLRHGTLSVDVRPQPVGRPMLVRTPTAEVEVVGTVFSVSADSQVTRLGVDEGSVRFLRLADRQSVEVREHNVATASLVATEPLEAGRPVSIPATYREEFGGVHGKRALPYIAGRENDGRPIVHFGVHTRNDNFGFVTMHDDSVVSLRFRSEKPEMVRLMISMRRPGGGFGGNFEIKFPTIDATLVDSGDESSGAWRWIHIPAREFAPIIKEFNDLTPGHTIGMLLVATFTEAAQLEVAEVSVARRATAP
jgi:anti-sigma factor RsiW